MMPDQFPIVLLVEDDEDVRDTIANVLDLIGFSVVSVSTGKAALEVLRSPQPIDVLLSDVAMPPPNGIELAFETQALRPETKCVLISGYAGETLDMPEGCVFMSKPFSLDKLNSVLRQIIRTREPVSENA